MPAITINRRIGIFSVALALLAASGCIRESDEQGAHVIQFALWVPAAIFLGGIVAGAAGFFLRKHITRFGWGLLIAGPIIGLGIGPSMMLALNCRLLLQSARMRSNSKPGSTEALSFRK